MKNTLRAINSINEEREVLVVPNKNKNNKTIKQLSPKLLTVKKEKPFAKFFAKEKAAKTKLSAAKPLTIKALEK